MNTHVCGCVSPASWWSVAPRSSFNIHTELYMFCMFDCLFFLSFFYLFVHSFDCSFRAVFFFSLHIYVLLFIHSTRVQFLFILWPLRSIPIWCAPVFLVNRSDCMHVWIVRTDVHRHTCPALWHRQTHVQWTNKIDNNNNNHNRREHKNERSHSDKSNIYVLLKHSRARIHYLSVSDVGVLMSLRLHMCVHIVAAFQ